MTDAPDDHSIANDCRLFRRITNYGLAPAPERPGGFRISTAAFQPSSDGSGISVSIEDRMLELGIQPLDLIADHADALLAFITAGAAREQGKGIVREATEQDPAHGNMTGPDSRPIRKRLVAAAEWVKGPAD